MWVWKVAEKCWNEKASERPEVEEVLQDLEDRFTGCVDPQSMHSFAMGVN
jgi:hypothetical protein